ncbi:GntR family transcriptional regulator, partial [Salipiger bermudensis]
MPTDPADALTLDPAQNSVDQATRLIREDILSGRIAPGDRLKTAELAKQLGFSTMPLREALRKLEGEGLVAIEPNRGATVRK